jgi:predicted MFS family arabinose efflux permease
MSRPAELSAFCAFFVLGALTASIGASLPSLRAEFGSGHAVGNIVSVYNGGALASTAVIGLLGRRIRVRLALRCLLVLFAAGTAGMGISPSWGFYLSCSAVAGLGYGGLTLFLNTAFARGFGAGSMVKVNRLNAVFGIGAMLGPLAAGAAGRADIRLLALAACAASLACFLAQGAGAVLEQPRAAALPDRTGRAPGASLAPAAVALFLAVGLFYAGTETSIGAWQSTHLERSGWEVQAATAATAGFWAGMALGRIVLPQLLQRVHPGTAIPAYLVGAVAMLALAAVPHLAVVAYPLAGLCLAPVLPTLLAWLSGLVSVPQRATSALTMCCMLGNAAVPAAVQALVEHRAAAAIPLTLATACAICLVLALLAQWARSTGRTQPRVP